MESIRHRRALLVVGRWAFWHQYNCQYQLRQRLDSAQIRTPIPATSNNKERVERLGQQATFYSPISSANNRNNRYQIHSVQRPRIL